jgi:carbon starvation protein CstA
MYTFIGSIVLLIVGYVVYGRFAERVFGIDVNKPTPAVAHPDGVDYVQLPWWKVFMIQFLNIAGLGPIFGAVMGIMYGQAAFLWIVFGTIFAGAVHDYLSGMMSIRMNGASQPELVGSQLGKAVKHFMRLFSFFLMVLVGAVFVSGPAELLAAFTEGSMNASHWVLLVFAYYLIATVLPVDKVIGRIYPLFGFALLFMAAGILVAIIVNNAPVPEITEGLKNQHPRQLPIFPVMFISIACGAISGFHATQSPLMARCIQNERYGRRVFYGSMVAEGIVALIWAAAAASFFGSIEGLQVFVGDLAATVNKPAVVVDLISREWLGQLGGVLALLGVIAAPLTSGDTALRSARLIVADAFSMEQKSIRKRLLISIPIFAITFLLLLIDFDVLWRYFAWFNQTLATFTLWAVTVYLYKKGKFYFISLLPALWMTAVTSTYLLIAPEGLSLHPVYAYAIGGIVTLLIAILFLRFMRVWKSAE